MIILDSNDFAKIVNIIDAGKVVALPTDTIYGLVCKFDYEEAIQKIYKIKNRPLTKPFQILVGSWEQAKIFGVINDQLINYLEKKFLKGHVTVIVKKQMSLDKIAYWKQWDSVAIRVSSNPLVRNLTTALGPLIATSCNVTEQQPINESDKINLPHLNYVVNGRINNGKPSALYNSLTDKILRI